MSFAQGGGGVMVAQPPRLILGDAREALRELPAGSADCCVTSPPYWCVKDYGGGGSEMGWEPSVGEYISALVEVFREVRRVLKPGGTVALNLGDVFHNRRSHNNGHGPPQTFHSGRDYGRSSARRNHRRAGRHDGLKDKDLVGVPWATAFALRDDGWWLRDAITWCKPNPVPDRLRDRTAQASEMVFLLAKHHTYYWDAGAINHGNVPLNWWTVAATGRGDHVGTMPVELARRLVRAGCPAGGTVIDPFMGVATTGVAAHQEGRNFIGCDVVPSNISKAARRLAAVQVPLL